MQKIILAIRGYIRYYDWMSEVQGERIGILSIAWIANDEKKN
ncbi:hypothetical protein ig2599ANME_0892 [groundwater metagenome]